MTVFERKVFLQKVFVTDHARNTWSKVVHLFGLEPDKKVAKKLGVSTAAVCSVRVKMGIPPVNFEKVCARYRLPFPEVM